MLYGERVYTVLVYIREDCMLDGTFNVFSQCVHFEVNSSHSVKLCVIISISTLTVGEEFVIKTNAEVGKTSARNQ